MSKIVFQFPEKLNAEAAKKIASALPKTPKPESPKASEDVKMEEFDGQGTWGGESANGAAAEEDSEVPVGIRERLLELEKKVPVIAPKGPVPKDVYARIKALEDRVRYLEGISPEYFCNFVKMESESDNGSASGSSGAGDRGEDLAKSLSGINTRIQQLQASLMVKKRETE